MHLLQNVFLCTTGYGVFATRDFEKNEFLLEYAGSLHAAPDTFDCSDQTYIYYFSIGNKHYRSVNLFTLVHLCIVLFVYSRYKQTVVNIFTFIAFTRKLAIANRSRFSRVM